jgi:hypothetical protein
VWVAREFQPPRGRGLCLELALLRPRPFVGVRASPGVPESVPGRACRSPHVCGVLRGPVSHRCGCPNSAELYGVDPGLSRGTAPVRIRRLWPLCTACAPERPGKHCCRCRCYCHCVPLLPPQGDLCVAPRGPGCERRTPLSIHCPCFLPTFTAPVSMSPCLLCPT